MKNKRRDWKLLIDFLGERLMEAWKIPSYVLYFFVVIVLVGTFGVITELFTIDYCLSCKFDHFKVKNSCFNISSTGLALVTASVIELIFIPRKSIEKETKELNLNFDELENLKRGVRIFGLSSLIISFIFWILINNIFDIDLLKIIFSSILLLFAYFIWWISNVRNKILSNYMKNYVNIIGGNADTAEGDTAEGEDKQESNLNGDLTNFNTGV
ncbi:hypothetical protein J3D55_002376 [Chryseobacterium ginsenosidimutans]|uniref:hypothetical protein n=1 Tax=Chryseobacterium ginsenosidimutans TaxID=687846 RepID=UPI002168290C|nr:hypothetical protein [Chryseobacterium ginsenosidimutans]MCS3869460.1 hypothetical protein [Chryseobacterium ginsenosidimutans]